MARTVLVQPGFWFDGARASADLAAISLEFTKEIGDETAFGSTYNERLSGLKHFSLSGEMVVDDGSSRLAAAIIGDQEDEPAHGIWTLAPGTNPDPGDTAYLVQPFTATANPLSGSVGDAHRMSFSGEGDADPYRGTLLFGGEHTGSSTGYETVNSSWFEVGSGSVAPQWHIHITGRSATTNNMEVRIQRASTITGGSAETMTTATLTPTTAFRGWRGVGSSSTKRFFRIQIRPGATGRRITCAAAVAAT